MGHWPVFLINMAKDTDRLAAARAELDLAGVQFTRIEAVNGRALSPEARAEVYDAAANARRARHPLTGPEIGCYLSHIRAWEAILATGAPGGVVLEDDLRVAGDLAAALSALAEDGGDWDLAKLFTFRPDVKLIAPRELLPGLEIGTPYRVPSTTLAYAIRAEAASRLLYLSQPFFRPIDEDHKFFWEKDISVALLRPAPIRMGRQETAEGTVGEARRAATRDDGRSAARRIWQGIRYQAGYAAGLHWHRMFRR
ncbi:glycosyl transferase family 25 [Rhodobacterales bacterium HKCCE2091]|nr:glycosyl transferase family 25 [Rhodobacterales bacterium HKCCE2091]